MRICIDACCWSNRRGFGRFTRELLRELTPLAVAQGNEVVLLADQATVAGAARDTGDDCEQFPRGAQVVAVETSVQQTSAAAADGSRSLGDLLRMSRAMRRSKPDVVFFPAVYTFYPAPWGTPAVVTLHDAIAEQLPGLIFPNSRARLFWSLKMKVALWQATRVLTVSDSAKQQIMNVFHLPDHKIHVTTEGPSRDFSPIRDEEGVRRVRDTFGILAGSDVILYVGGISPHKNLEGLVRAVHQLAARPNWRLVLVGDYSGDSFHSCFEPLRVLITDLGLTDRVIFTGFVANDVLRSLYHAATMLVLPSFSEGFGLPVIEAMACGIPVVVSQAGSLPEIAGDAGVLFDPHRPSDIAAAIASLFDNPAEADRRCRAGLEQAQKYSWCESARRVLAVLEGAVANRD